VIAYPTEAVFGLGCLPTDADAVERILDIKRRSWRKGLLLIAADVDQVESFAELPTGAMRARIAASWPGPNTWLLRAKPLAPDWITGGRGCIAMRVTAHPLARALCARVGTAIVSTSANRARQRPHTNALRLRHQLGAEVDYILPGALGNAQKPTAIRDGRNGNVIRAD
jgi:L-threonylcarbamoyladenylate synthase